MKTRFFLLAMAIITSSAILGCQKELTLTDPGALVPKTVDQDPSLPSILVNNTQLHAETFGNPDSPMIVMLHGGPGVDYRNMLGCQQFAENGYYVVFYDQRGSGLSQRDDKDVYSIQIMLDDLTGVIDHYRKSPNQKVFLLGHSWGAMLATAYVNENPSAIRGVILAEPGGFTWSDVESYINRTRVINPFSESTNDVLYPDQIITGKENEQEILDYKMALSSASDFAKGNVQGIEGPSPFWRFGSVIQSSLFDIANRDGFDFTTNLNQYSQKVLFLYSENNTAYGAEYAQHVSAAYPNVVLEEVKGTGHEMIYFGWNNFYPLALDYLNSLK